MKIRTHLVQILYYKENNLTKGLISLLLLGQVTGLVVGRISPHRYFSWAPFEETSFYEIHVSLNGKSLSEEDILKCWKINYLGRHNRSIHQVISILRWCEKRADHPAEVQVDFRTNGGHKKGWKWPEDEISFSN